MRLIFSLLLLIAIAALSTAAQTGSSRITGRIGDSKGATIPGASVSVSMKRQVRARRQTTTDAGVFSFDSLPVGAYTVSVEQPGFKKFQKTGNVFAVGTPLTVDVAMEVGQVTETVIVQEEMRNFNLLVDSKGGTFQADWEINLNQFVFNQLIDKQSFTIAAYRQTACNDYHL